MLLITPSPESGMRCTARVIFPAFPEGRRGGGGSRGPFLGLSFRLASKSEYRVTLLSQDFWSFKCYLATEFGEIYIYSLSRILFTWTGNWEWNFPSLLHLAHEKKNYSTGVQQIIWPIIWIKYIKSFLEEHEHVPPYWYTWQMHADDGLCLRFRLSATLLYVIL